MPRLRFVFRLSLTQSCCVSADPCPPYSFGSLSKNSCRFCAAGTLGPADSNSYAMRGWSYTEDYACTPCVAGKYRAATQKTDTCTICPVGKYASLGEASCQQCASDRVTGDALGAAISTPGATQCIKCPSGKGPVGGTSCASCTGSSFSDGGACRPCAVGKVPLPSRAGCESCAPGMNTRHGKCVCDSGYFNRSFGLVVRRNPLLFCAQVVQNVPMHCTEKFVVGAVLL